MSSSEQWAWFAGLFEGEGCGKIETRSGRQYVGLEITMTDEDVLVQVHEWFGGNLSGPYQKKKMDGTPAKPQWRWGVRNPQDVATVIEGIRPWMKNRRGSKLDEIVAAIANKTPYKPTEEHKAKLRESALGHPVSEETRRKISETRTRRNQENQPQ